MRLSAALEGDLARYMEEELELAERAVTLGVLTTGANLKAALKADTEAALGRRMGRTWRVANYPARGYSLEAASFLHSKAPELVRAFDEGATIRSQSGRFLAVPTPAAPEKGIGRKRLTPANFPEHRYGPLRYVYVNRRLSLLVAENQRERKGKRGGYVRSRSKRALRTGYGLVSVPMFYLLPQVRLKPRLRVDEITEAEVAKLASNIDRAFRALGA
ncbi:DUF6441 family protein [Roseivivax isoporae]|uniref:Uncharacterized protein n=1 Tax=Roseivivax isoporae LMG 25204 TaxID=1449351 RepID=X7F453_9RHOB|nr:DUF6441 family protein [Roseivivax isoporae]ETX26854.1 hypothetical protein RISW2_18840 [Roseivivax isoporae LMG 25204]